MLTQNRKKIKTIVLGSITLIDAPNNEFSYISPINRQQSVTILLCVQIRNYRNNYIIKEQRQIDSDKRQCFKLLKNIDYSLHIVYK